MGKDAVEAVRAALHWWEMQGSVGKRHPKDFIARINEAGFIVVQPRTYAPDPAGITADHVPGLAPAAGEFLVLHGDGEAADFILRKSAILGVRKVHPIVADGYRRVGRTEVIILGGCWCVKESYEEIMAMLGVR